MVDATTSTGHSISSRACMPRDIANLKLGHQAKASRCLVSSLKTPLPGKLSCTGKWQTHCREASARFLYLFVHFCKMLLHPVVKESTPHKS